MTTVRPAGPPDTDTLRHLAVATGLFAADQLDDFDEMLGGYLDGTLEGHAWVILEREGGVEGAAYFAPEPFADRVWNLYFLAVSPDEQGSGFGATLVDHVEGVLRARGEAEARVLIVETSGTAGFERTRAFYRGRGFVEEARIREFYGPGDDKVVFWKSLVAR